MKHSFVQGWIWLSIFLTSALPLSSAWAGAFILEYQGDIKNHTANIIDILCSEETSCRTYVFSEFMAGKEQEFQREMALFQPQVVNFSFVLQRQSRPSIKRDQPLESYHEELRTFEKADQRLTEEIENLESLIRSNPETLFAMGAGNGISIAGLWTMGIALGEKNILYPAVFSEPNTLSVAALNSDIVNLSSPENLNLADYSNFGLTTVDIMAPVPRNREGTPLRGTSYSTPVVAMVADHLAAMGQLSTVEIKQILLKSCYVKNIDAALAASKDLQAKGRDSVVHQAMYHDKRRIRQELEKQIGHVLLVRSGGPLITAVAKTCAALYLGSKKKRSIEESCLEAHQTILGHQANPAEKLKSLWEIRQL